jgi:hypothetical protein
VFDPFNQYKQCWLDHELDTDHPWCQAGLFALFMFDEGGGAACYDLCGNVNLSRTGTSAWGIGSEPGLSCASTSGNPGAQATLVSALQLPMPLTVACGLRRLGASVSFGAIAGLYSNNANTNSKEVVNIVYNNTAGALSVRFGATSTTEGTLNFSGAIGNTTSDHVVAASIQNNAQNVYLDGGPSGSSAAAAVATYNSTALIAVGNYATSTNFGSNSLIYWAGFWSSYLSPAMHAEIGSNVNAIREILRRRRRPLYFQSSATAYSLVAGAGSYALSGQAATLTSQRSLSAAAGSYALSGQASTLSTQRRLSAGAGSYSLSGQSATLTTHRVLACSAGVYTLSGQSATFTNSGGGTALVVYVAPRAMQLVAAGTDADPFGVDPRQVQLVAAGTDTDPFGVDPRQVHLVQ